VEELTGLVARRFEVLSKAGEGGMGEVYRVRDWQTNSVAALKVLAADQDHQLERFARESALLEDLKHDGIVQYISHGQLSDGRPYLAMEWLDGESLNEHLDRQLLTVGEALTMAEGVAEAMGAAHDKGVVHRDLKPGNVFLMGSDVNQVKLLDFGIASARGSHKELTESTTMLGTPGYMAPEQMRSSRDASASADVFSLGCVVFKSLTGTIPFEGKNTMDLVLSVMTRPPLPILALRQDATRPIADLLERLLHKDPAERPANGSEAAELVRRTRDKRDAQTHESYRPPSAGAGLHAPTMETLVVRHVDTRTEGFGVIDGTNIDDHGKSEAD
jgi:eukaryotic-like serine/threonine-protein kinase